MPFTLDQANLGSVVGATGSATSFTLTTSQTAAAGALIALAFGNFNGAATISFSVSGGGLTWAIPVSNGLGASTDACALAYALAPNGLASGTVITVTGSPASDI